MGTARNIGHFTIVPSIVQDSRLLCARSDNCRILIFPQQRRIVSAVTLGAFGKETYRANVQRLNSLGDCTFAFSVVYDDAGRVVKTPTDEQIVAEAIHLSQKYLPLHGSTQKPNSLTDFIKRLLK